MVFRLLMPQLAYDFDVLAYRASIQGNGGTVSDARMAVINTFVTAEKVSGAWALTDDYWALWAESETQALTSLKQRRLATVTAAPTFTTDRGYDFNGSTQCINTGFIPSTHKVALTGTSYRLASYERTNLAAGNVNCGVSDGTSTTWVGPRSGATANLVRANASGNVVYTLPGAESRGLSAVSLSGNTLSDHKSYKDGSPLVYASGSPTFTNTLPAFALYIGGANVSGTLTFPRASSIGFVAIGAALSAAQELAQHNAVQAFAAAVGAQV